MVAMANPIQPAIDAYLQVLNNNGYTGGPMGNSWWNQPAIMSAHDALDDATRAYNQQNPSRLGMTYDKHGNPSAAIDVQKGVPFGDTNGQNLGDFINNPAVQIFSALASAGSLGSALGLGSLAGDAAAAGESGLAAGGAAAGDAAASGSGFLGGVGDAFSGLGQAANALPNAIGSGLSSLYSAAGSPLSGIGSYLSDAADSVGKGISSLTGGASDGLSSFLGGTSSLSNTGSGLSDFSSGLQGAPDTSPIASAARDAISGSTASAAPSSNFLSGYLPSGGGAGAVGGTAGGFFANAPDVPTGLAAGLSGPIGSSTGDFASGITGASAPSTVSSFLDNPVDSLKNAATSGVKNMLSPASLLGGAAKTGLSLLLDKNNANGYGAVQTAANQAATNYQPFLTSGQQATTQLSDLLGTNGQAAAQAATQNWQNTPGYQFALSQGLKGIDAGAASRGMLSSGNTLQAEQQYGTGLADQYYNQYLQNLQNQVNPGLAGAQGVGSNDVNAAIAFQNSKANPVNNYNKFIGSLSNFL